MKKNWLFTAQKLKARAMTYLKTIAVLMAVLTSLAVSAQQLSEKDIALQEKFIDASRERILGNYDKAAAIYEDILKEDPNNHAVAYELSRLYDTLDKGDKALEFIKKSISIAPDNEWYQRFLADVYQKQGKNLDAATLYEGLVKKEPDNEYFYHRWAYFLLRANEYSKALKVYDELEKRKGISEDIIRRKHSLYVGLGNNKKAAEELERLIAAFPSNPDYYHSLAGFYEQLGENELAKQVYRRLLAFAPEDPRASMALAGTPKGSAANNDVQYLQSLRPIFQKSDVSIDLKIQKLIPFITKVAETGDATLAAAALELTQILETIHPDEAKSYAASADLLYYSGDKAKALEKYKKTLDLDDTVFLVWEQLLRIYEESRDFANLRKASESAMDIFPNKASIYYMNGIANDELNRPEDALDVLEQATRMVGNDGQLLAKIQVRKGLVYSDLKQIEKSNQAFEQALKLNPKDPIVLNSYSYCLALRGENLDKAKSMAKQANDLVPNNPAYQATYGWVSYKSKDYKTAKEWLQKAIDNGAENEPITLEHFGDVLFQMNDVEGAMQYWNKAQEKGGSSELLEKKITDRKLYE
ncbi:MAG: tetratricopeptide repeat protein [Saprospiraceae bacterium]